MKLSLPKTVATRMIFFIACDIFLISLAVFLAFWVRFDGKIPPDYFLVMNKMIILTIIFILPIFYLQKLYHFSWAYVSIGELIYLLKATTISFIFLGITMYIYRNVPSFRNFPRSTILISYFLVIVFCGGVRLAKRIYSHFSQKNFLKQGERTLIIGAGDAGEQVLRNMISHKTSYSPVGFIDDNPFKQNIIIHGLMVLGKIEDIPKIIKRERIESIIIAMFSAGSEAIKKTVELGRKAGLKKIRILPSVFELIDGQFSIKDLREVEIEDLLGRKKASLNLGVIENFIKGKKVLVTGAAGSIGSELCRQIIKFNPSSLLVLDQDETGIFNISEELRNKFPNSKIYPIIADILDKERINRIFGQFNPEIVFHAAAYKHVPLMENNPGEAVKNNIFGTKIIAKASLDCGADKFVFISSDKAVNPTSIMGATKRAGEMICQVLNQKNHTKFISVRFGNVLNSRGSVIPIFKEQIRRGGPVEITHPDMKRYFMLTSEAVLLVLQSSQMGKGGEVFVLDMGKPVRIVDLAKEMIRLSGLEPDKDIPLIFTQPRPGEKFFEEILNAEEGTIATQNQEIFMAKLKEINEEKLNSVIDKLKEATDAQNEKEIKALFKDLISSYQPENFD